MSNEMDYTVRDKNLIITLNQDLDHHNAECIRTRIDKLVDYNGILNIVFDFTNVTFMDSSGIGVIMGRYKKVYYDGGKIAVVGINKAVDRIFTMSALYKIATKYKDVESAIKAF